MSILHNSKDEDKIGSRPFHYDALTAFAKPLGEWKTGNLSFEDFEAYQSLVEKYPQIKEMDSAGKRKFFIEMKAEIQQEIAGKRSQKHEAELRLKLIEKSKAIIEKLLDWSEDLKIERPDGVSFRKMRKDFAEDRTLYLDKTLDGVTPKVDFEKEVFRFAEILLIEHDWAEAFKNAEITDAVVKLPYDVCAFEFRFSGRPVIALATQFGTEIAFTPVVLIDDLWVVTDLAGHIGGDYRDDDETPSLGSLFREVARQVRAACISLDAEVAKAEVVREPHTGAQGKNSHQLLKPYHVVSLARRGPRPLASIGTETGRRVRLHFRRGHWRHFATHKTWLKWQLVGSPDLGFIDKHYKL